MKLKKRFVGFMVAALMVLGTVNSAFAQTTDRAYSIEYFNNWWCYDGTAEFKPNYTVPKNAGYSLVAGKNVKQSYVNYTRKKNGVDVSVIGGRSYSPVANSKKTNAVYKAEATAKDSLNIFTNQTHFWYGWLYF